jgi:Fibronectin type III domain/MBG domain (YGX type)
MNQRPQRSGQHAQARTPDRARIVALALTMLITAFTGSVGAPRIALASGNTLYVDGSVSSSGSDCSNPITPCKTITDALNQASTNSGITTVDIAGASSSFNGVYCEQPTINRSLTLQADAAGNPPTIDGAAGTNNPCSTVPGDAPGHSVVTVGNGSNSPTVTLSHVTIQHGDDSGGNGAGGGLSVNSGATLNVIASAITASTGNSSSCAPPNPCSGVGGGIVNSGTLTLANSTVSGNQAMYCSSSSSSCTGDGGGIYNSSGSATVTNSAVGGNVACNFASNGTCNGNGGGIYDGSGTVAVSGSTVSQGTACPSAAGPSSGCSTGDGGGIYNSSGTVTVTNSTVSENTACSECSGPSPGNGGGIYSGNGGATTVTNSTVSENLACGGCENSGAGGGIYGGGTAALSNTILAGNFGATSSPDCAGTPADGKPSGPSGPTVGDNVIGAGEGCFGLSNGTNGDQVGTTGSLVNPRLGRLQANGGPTQTMALLSGSPAIGHGDGSTCQAATITAPTAGGGTITVAGPHDLDQRGERRLSSPSIHCDVGAFDTLGNPTVYVAPSGSDTNTCASANAPCQHIRIGLATVSSGGTVNIAEGTYCEQVLIDRSVTLQGNGTAGNPAIDGGAGTGNLCAKPLDFESAVTVGDANSTMMTVTLRGLTIQHGDASGNPTDAYNAPGVGGGIFVYPGVTLTIVDSAISANTACSTSGCSLGHGGGLYASGNSFTASSTTLTASTVSGNTACGSSSCSGNSFGGGLYLTQPTVMVNSTVSGNQAAGGAGILNGASLQLTNDTISQNTATTTVGGIGASSGSSITMVNTIDAGNNAPDRPDCGATITSQGYNILGDATGCTISPTTGDQFGVSAGQLNLGSLANNGGPTQTMALGLGSIAMGHGDAGTCTAAPVSDLDQRGDPRNAASRGACDVGAFDVGGPPAAPTSVMASQSNGTVTVSWAAPVSPGSTITEYDVTCIDTSKNNATGCPSGTANVTGNPATTSTQISGLTGGDAYTFTVTATNIAGTGPASQPSNAVTLPTPVVVTAVGPTVTYGQADISTTYSTSSSTLCQSGPPNPYCKPRLVNPIVTCSYGGAPVPAIQATGLTTARSGAPAGSYPTNCWGAYDPSYLYSYVAGTLTVNQAPMTIRPNRVIVANGAKLPRLTWKAHFVNHDTAASLSRQPRCRAEVRTNNAGRITSPAGSYAVRCSGARDANYTIRYARGRIRVVPRR